MYHDDCTMYHEGEKVGKLRRFWKNKNY